MHEIACFERLSDMKAAKAYRGDMKDGQVRCLRYDSEEPGKLVGCVIFRAVEANSVHTVLFWRCAEFLRRTNHQISRSSVISAAAWPAQ